MLQCFCCAKQGNTKRSIGNHYNASAKMFPSLCWAKMHIPWFQNKVIVLANCKIAVYTYNKEMNFNAALSIKILKSMWPISFFIGIHNFVLAVFTKFSCMQPPELSCFCIRKVWDLFSVCVHYLHPHGLQCLGILLLVLVICSRPPTYTCLLQKYKN